MRPDYQTAIIGAGFSGIIAAIHLKRSGRHSFAIFEKAARIGGTWRDNTYPGCACDIASVLYSIAGEPNPDWSHTFSPQAEIWAYMEDVVRRRRLEDHLHLETEINRFEFLPEHGCWRLEGPSGQICTARTVLLATGPLNRPKWPDLPGLDTFQGKAMHSFRWDRSFDLRGKRVAVVGTGASAIQIIPAIAPEVGQLTVFQRTPAWVADRRDAANSAWSKALYRRFPALQALSRTIWYHMLEARGTLFFKQGFAYRLVKNQCLWKLRREVQDPETRQKLTPDYRLGCKRIAVSDDYFPTFNRPNVALETTPIEAVVPQGLRTADGTKHPFDVLVFATGFGVTTPPQGVDILGLNGQNLYNQWRAEGMEAHKGTVVSGYPNLCVLVGPNTGLGHNSLLLMIEAQMEYVLRYLDTLEQAGEGAWLDVRPEAQRHYNEHLHQQLAHSAWNSGCTSWYVDKNGKNSSTYPGRIGDFRRDMRDFDSTDFQQQRKGVRPRRDVEKLMNDKNVTPII